MRSSEPSRPARRDDSSAVQRRRWIAGLSLASAALIQTTAAIPDARRGWPFRTRRRPQPSPTAFWPLLSYGVTALLVGVGGRGRTRAAPWLPLALTTKTAFDVAAAVGLAAETRRRRARSSLPLAAAAISFAALGLSLFECRAALRPLEWRAAEIRRRAGRIVGRAQHKLVEGLPSGWRRRSLEELARRAF